MSNNLDFFIPYASTNLLEFSQGSGLPGGIGTLHAYSGEREDLDLITYAIFRDIDAREGQNASYELTTFPPALLDPLTYSAENALFELSVELAIEIVAYSDENALFLLDAHPSIDLGIIANYSDQSIEQITLVTSSVLPITAYFGENQLLTLTAYPGYEFIIPIYGDEYSTLALATTSLIDGKAYSGQYGTSSLTTYIGIVFVPFFYPGTTAEVALRTVDSLVPSAYAGQYSDSSLENFPATPIEPVAYSDQTAIIGLQISFQLPIGRSYSGTYAVVNQIDSEPNIHFYGDALLEASLSTTDIFKTSVMGTGENCLAVLQVGKSEGLGTFRVYPGTELLTTFDIKHHADLYVMFRTSIMTQVDIGSATYFDLNTDACCGVRRETLSNNLMMHLFVKDYLPEAISDGDRVVFSVDLRCNPRLSIEFDVGHTLEFKEYDGYLSVDFAEGTEGILNQFDADLTHKLCKGYFVPNGNWLVVEMNDVLPEDCYADVFYSGSTLSCILSDDIVIRVNNNYGGEHLSPSLTTFPPWLLIFYSGEILYCELALEVGV